MYVYGLLAYNSSKPKVAHMLEAKPSAIQKMVDMSPDRRSATFWTKNTWFVFNYIHRNLISV